MFIILHKKWALTTLASDFLVHVISVLSNNTFIYVLLNKLFKLRYTPPETIKDWIAGKPNGYIYCVKYPTRSPTMILLVANQFQDCIVLGRA